MQFDLYYFFDLAGLPRNTVPNSHIPGALPSALMVAVSNILEIFLHNENQRFVTS